MIKFDGIIVLVLVYFMQHEKMKKKNMGARTEYWRPQKSENECKLGFVTHTHIMRI